MKPTKKAPSAKSRKKYPPNSFLGKLRKRGIIATLAAFIGGGWLTLEFVHWILIDHYHFPEKSLDITFVTLICALICTLAWRWFRGAKKPRRFKVELFLIPLVILLTVLFDIYLFLQIKEPEAEDISQSRWKNSIAVLPFVNISGEEEQEYFCDGLTEELINRLSNIKELKVPSRTSSFAFKGEKIDIREVGEKLNVDKVLEGSVRKTEDHIRITAQLINIADGYHLWSQKFDRNIEDVFAIQDEISLAIVNNLKVKLMGGEEARLTKHYTENLEAYNLYLRGRWFWNRRTEEGLKKAIENFERAIEEDPNYALAYAGLADSYVMLNAYSHFPSKEAYMNAKEATLKALDIDSTLAEAHTSLAYIKMRYEYDWDGAERDYKRAIELNPNYATAHHWYGLYLMGMGRSDEAIEQTAYAYKLEPYSLVINRAVGEAFYWARQYDQAIQAWQKTIEMDPEFSLTHLHLGKAYLQKSMYKEALAAFQKEKDIFKGRDLAPESWIGITYLQMGKRSEAQAVLEDLLERPNKQWGLRALVGLCFALGEKDQGFKWLEKGYEERHIIFWVLREDMLFGSVRSDPRFKAFLKKINLE